MVKLNNENPYAVTIDQNSGEPKPYIHIRSGLKLLLTEKLYRLIEICSIKTHNKEEWFGIFSKKISFPSFSLLN